jgi:hypothetical protein
MDNEPLSMEGRHFKAPHAVPPPVSAKKRKSTEDGKRQSDPTSSDVADDPVKRQRSTATDTASAAKSKQGYISM